MKDAGWPGKIGPGTLTVVPGPQTVLRAAVAALALVIHTAVLMNLTIQFAWRLLSRGQINHAHRPDRLLQASKVSRPGAGDPSGRDGPNRQGQRSDGRSNPESALHRRFTSFMGICRVLAGKLDCTSCGSCRPGGSVLSEPRSGRPRSSS